MGIYEKLFGTFSDKEIKKINRIVDKIEALADKMRGLSDNDLRAKTEEFKERLSKGEGLDDILPEAYAVVREAAQRVIGQTHYRVQLIGGVVLHQGRIAEMKTGEGKTLSATLPAYLNGLTGKGVHVVTVNDYLAKRDREWMGQIFEFLGLKVGVILHDMDHNQRKEAYNCDIVYGTNNEFGFDYLRDNMVIYKDQMVQRELQYAIVDEVDSILIDEARTPLIISGQGDKSTDLYFVADRFVKTLKKEDHFAIDEKANTVVLTEEGEEKAEKFFGIENLADPENIDKRHHILNALKAHTLMKADKDYVVKEGEVIIVDEFTGRMMFGRRYSDGLHQAIEAKEGLKVRRESKTLATITLQNYFRMYNKLAGMTGTALTEEDEFRTIYGLEVVVIPTNKPIQRQDLSDVVYKTEKGKFDAAVNEIAERHAKGQPILVGTISIEKSEELSSMLKKKGVPHNVLNAKYHEMEAEIVSKAGQRGAVTIATNMAGRGTDIVLGEDVPALGGLHIIGTERHESRRIDNQLRGRSGRQGDPGSTRFYISLEDDLMRLFGSDRVMGVVEKLGLPEDMPIEANILSKSIESAQKKVEAKNFDIRKYVLQYDDVMNKQRETIYSQRKRVLEGESLKDGIFDMIEGVVSNGVELYTAHSQYAEEWDIDGLVNYCQNIFGKGGLEIEKSQDNTKEDLKEQIMQFAERVYNQKEQEVGSETMREVERVVLLRVVDEKWMDHIDAMDQLKQGIGLRAYGQVDPVRAYQVEGYDMFQEMISNIQQDTVTNLFNIRISHEAPQREQVAVPTTTNYDDSLEKKPVVKGDKIGRNDDCPCGSGKKYKKCCGN